MNHISAAPLVLFCQTMSVLPSWLKSPVPSAVYPVRLPRKGQRGGVHFDGALNIPFSIELAQPLLDQLGMARQNRHAIFEP
jgi:hypothetical protein